MSELRLLQGTTGQVRTALDYQGRPTLVVPVVALIGDLVIHAINSKHSEMVPLTTLSRAPEEWAQKPVVFGHPTDKDGRQISANDPLVLERHGLGTVSNPRIENGKLCVDAIIDEGRAEKIGGAEFLEALRSATPCEVSVGCFVQTELRVGEQGGRAYKAVWNTIAPDHLAFLARGRGACSISDGCGTHRAAEGAMTEEELKALAGELSLDDRIRLVNDQASKQFSQPPSFVAPYPSPVYAVVYPSYAIVKTHDKMYRVSYEIRDNQAVFTSEPVLVEMTTTYDPVMATLRAAIGARNSAADKQTMQAAHDALVALGAECTPMKAAAEKMKTCEACGGTGEVKDEEEKEKEKEDEDESRELRAAAQNDRTTIIDTLIACKHCPFTEDDRRMLEQAPDERLQAFKAAGQAKKTAAEAAQGDTNMTAEQRAEVVKTLMANKYSGFTAGDEKMLEAASDDRLDAFRVASEARENEDKALRAAAAKTLTVEEFMSAAPPELKALISRQQQTETTAKAALITELKAAQDVYSETELSVMSVDDLTRMARLAKVDTAKIDFSGKGLPRALASDTESYTPPNPYEKGLKALQAH